MVRSGLIAAVIALALVSGPAGAQEETASAPEAPPIAQSITDPEARALIDAAQAADPEADPAAALAAWRDAFQAAERAAPDERLALAQIRNQLGAALFYAGEREEAAGHFEAASEAFADAGPDWAENHQEALGNLGSILVSLGRLEESEAAQREALEIRRTLYPEAHPQIARSYFELGSVLNAQGRLEEASELVLQSLDIRIQTLGEDHPHVAMTRVSLASILTSARRYDEALEQARLGLESLEANLPAGHPFIGFAKSNYAGALNAAGRYREAEPFLRAIIEERRSSLGDAHPEVADSLNNLAVALNSLGRREQARALFLAARDIYLQSEGADSPTAARMRANAADLAGPDRLAEQRAALADFDRVGIAGGEARLRLLSRLAISLSQAGEQEAALARLSQAREIAETLFVDGHEARLALDIDEAWIRSEDPRQTADAAALAAPAALALMTRSILDIDRSRDAAARSDAALRRALDVAYAAEDASLAAALLDRGRAGALALAVEAAAARDGREAGERVRRRQDAARRLRLAEERYVRLRSNAAGADAIAAAAQEREAALSELSSADADLGSPAASFIPADLDRVQAELEADEAILAFAFTERGGVALAIGQEALALSRLAISREAAAEAVRAVRASLSAGAGAFRSGDLQEEARGLSAFPADAAYDLYAGVFTDAVRRITADKAMLATLPDGPYASIPFTVLLTEPTAGVIADPDAFRAAPWLVRRHGVSTGVRLAAPDDTAPAPASRLFAAGAPAFAGGIEAELGAVVRGGAVDTEALSQLPALPGAAEELRRLQDLFGPGRSTILSGTAATETAVRSGASGDTDIIVFATHGLLPGEFEGVEEPALAFLPEPEGADDGLLTASEIASLRMSADWVVLSACNTFAAGETSPPDRLAEAFFYAGAQTLLVSHWAVRDDVAARMTVDVTGRAFEIGGARAHQRAIVALIDDPDLPGGSHPGVWGPFALMRR